MDHGMTLPGRAADEALKVVKGGLGNKGHTSGPPKPSHDQSLEPEPKGRSLAGSTGIPHGTSHGKEVVADDNAATRWNAKGIKGVAVISNMHQIKGAGTQQ
jgi:hypothetical protein